MIAPSHPVHFRRRAHRSHRSGVTLVEVTVSTLIIALMVIVSLRSTGRSVSGSMLRRDQSLAESLADALLMEVAQSNYEEPEGTVRFGREAGELPDSRRNWDDVDDYTGLKEDPPKDRWGQMVLNADGWTRKCEVMLVEVDAPNRKALDDQGLKLVSVSVTSPDGQTVHRQRLRSQWGMLEQNTPLPGKWLTFARINVRDIEGRTASTSVTLVNAAEDVSDD